MGTTQVWTAAPPWGAHSRHVLFFRHALPFSWSQRLLWRGWKGAQLCALHFRGAHARQPCHGVGGGAEYDFGSIHGKSRLESPLLDLLCHFLLVDHLPFAELMAFCFFPLSILFPSLLLCGSFSLHSFPFTFLLSFSAPFLPPSLPITTRSFLFPFHLRCVFLSFLFFFGSSFLPL